MRARRFTLQSLVLIGWTLLGLLFAANWYVAAVTMGDSVRWSDLLVDALAQWYAWALLAPGAVRLARRVPFARERLVRAALVHFALAIPFALAACFLAAAIDAVYCAATGRPESLARLFFQLALNRWHITLLTYFGVVAAAHLLDSRRRLAERELEATRLEAELARAQLQAIRTQLHPHFLFNALQGISTLMHRDVRAADRMLARLADLLRASLERDDAEDVRLADELEVARAFVEVEQARFADRLRVDFDVEPGALEARVPSFLLQPLIENAIRHGFEEGGGRITVSAAREGTSLRVEVSDDGRGVPDVEAVRDGVGLAATRARLEWFFGPLYRLELANGAGSGARVTVVVPFLEARECR